MQLKFANDNIGFGTNILDVKVPEHLRRRIPSNVKFLDDALGGYGFTPSTITLFTGEAGSGKTTLSLLMADSMSKDSLVIFNTGEESLHQVKMTAERLKLKNGFAAGQETHIPTFLEKVDKLRAANPDKKDCVIIIDSLQCMDDGKMANGEVNSKTPYRVLEKLASYAKQTFATIIVIGQVNKNGEMAGSNKLKHAVDVKLHLGLVTSPKSPWMGARFFKTEKNRFGSAGHIFYLGIDSNGFTELDRETAAM